jgi:hypothetical protein
MFSDKEQQKALTVFFRQKEKDLTAATLAAYKVGAEKLKKDTMQELRQNFKKSRNSAGFFKAVSAKAGLSQRGNPYARVSMKIKFMEIFQTGGTIKGNPWLIILLPDGAKLGFKRITKGNPWKSVWESIKSRASLIKVADGILIAYKKNRTKILIYKLQKSVTVSKKLTFLERGQAIFDSLPAEIERLLS